MEKGDDHPGASHSEWMAKSNGTASSVQFLARDLQSVDTHRGLGSECLIDFEHIDVVHSQTGFLQSNWNGVSWTNSHDFRRDSSTSETQESALDWKTILDGVRSLGQNDDGSAISDLTRVSSSGGASLLESWLQFGETFNSGVGSDTVVSVDHDFSLISLFILDNGLVWSDLLLRPAEFLGVGSLHVGLVSHLVLLLPGDTVFLRHVLTGDSHGHEALLSLIVLKDLFGECIGIDHIGHCEHGHALDATADSNLNLAACNLGSDSGTSLEA